MLSSAAFAGLLYMVIQGEDNPGFRSLKPFVLVGWTLFPAVFLLAPTGIGVLETAVAEAGYLLLDIATKIVFGINTSRLK
jgi:sensory rhodopsin